MLGYIISDKNKINVENYEIQPFDFLHKTDLNIFVIENNKVLYKNDIINYASAFGHVQVLEWFKNSGYEFKYNRDAFRWASAFGHVKVFEWFKNSGYEFKYNTYEIINASLNGRIEVLEWFKKSGYELNNELGIYYASEYERVQVLEWFINYGYELKYTKYILKTKFIKILKFYSNNINIKN